MPLISRSLPLRRRKTEATFLGRSTPTSRGVDREVTFKWIFDETIPPEWATALEKRINQKLGAIMGTVQDAVDAITVELGKAKDEIVAKIADLEAQIAAGETPDLTALKAAADALDDIVPDVVEEPPSP